MEKEGEKRRELTEEIFRAEKAEEIEEDGGGESWN